jgi:hypothetical protein
MKQFTTIEKLDRSITVSRFWHAIAELQFISSFFSWFFLLLSRLAEPFMLLSVLYVVVEAGIPAASSPALHNLAVAVMIAAPEIILPGAFVIAKQAKEHGEVNRPLLAICWLFVALTLITLVSLFVLHLTHEAIAVIMCFRCAAGVGYSILVRMLSYKGLAINQETAQPQAEQPAPFVITPELVETLRSLLAQQQTSVTEEQETEGKPLLLTDCKEETNTDNGQRVRAYLAQHPKATLREIADHVHISVTTANKWRTRILGAGKQKQKIRAVK